MGTSVSLGSSQAQEVFEVRYVRSSEERCSILKACHVDITSGHMGVKRTSHRILERFGVTKDIEIMTTSGNSYILTLRDYFTKWVEAVALPTKEASGIASSLFKILMKMGLPAVITTDQGSEFKNQLNDEMMMILNIRHHLITCISSSGPCNEAEVTICSQETEIQQKESQHKALLEEVQKNIIFAQKKQKEQYDKQHTVSLSPTKDETTFPTAKDSASAVLQESNHTSELQYSSLLSEKPKLLIPTPEFFPRGDGTRSRQECNTKTKLVAKLMRQNSIKMTVPCRPAIEDESYVLLAQDADQYWVPGLTTEDKKMITSGGWLSDEIVDAGQKLLKSTYPNRLQEAATGYGLVI
eukprot:Em0002g1084a